LLGALGGKSDRIRRRAIPAVAKLGDKRAIPLLENLLIGGFHQTRAAARASLKQLGADPVVHILKIASEPVTEEDKKAIKARYGSEAKYRAHIALALGETRDKRAVPKLQEMTRDKDKEVKQVAARALRNISRK